MDTTPTSPAHTIAVVDDDPMVAMLLNRVLTKAGYTVVVYQTGELLLEHLGTTHMDLVCLDMSLPGLNGLETLARVRTTTATLPVILFSAAADEVAVEARRLGAFACVPKTGAWDELRTTIAAALAAR